MRNIILNNFLVIEDKRKANVESNYSYNTKLDVEQTIYIKTPNIKNFIEVKYSISISITLKSRSDFDYFSCSELVTTLFPLVAMRDVCINKCSSRCNLFPDPGWLMCRVMASRFALISKAY